MDENINTYLSVQVQEIKGKQTDANLNILNLDIFALPPAQLLERHQLPSCPVNSYSLCIEHKGVCRILNALHPGQRQLRGSKAAGETHGGQLFDQIWIFLAHVFRISTEDSDRSARQLVNLMSRVNNPVLLPEDNDAPAPVLHRICIRM